MDHQQESQAPLTVSRVPSVVRLSTSSERSARSTPAPSVQGVFATPPGTSPAEIIEDKQDTSFTHRMRAVIDIRCGKELRNRFSIHEYILCDYSDKLNGISVKAKDYRVAYDHCEEILEQLSVIAMSEVSSDIFEKRGCRTKLFSLIEVIDKAYPLVEYQSILRMTIRNVLNQQCQNHNVTSRPKNVKAFQELPLDQRLDLLNFEGAFAVAEEVCAHLLKIKCQEEQKNSNNFIKSWAQGRLALRDTDERTVASLVEWAYDNTTLEFGDAEHLYDIWTLAARLKFELLAADCMDRIFSAASDNIDHAFANDISLGYLTGLDTEQDTPSSLVVADNILATVFKHVLRDKNPPPKLSDLVVHALARGMDSKLWAQLQTFISPDIQRRLIDALLASKETKIEQDSTNGKLIKFEGQQEGRIA
ncbi:hypothetical protein E8E13_008624 [Curvularia kusanoi]|uniref:BTB domain-containing protein n=1 Tax=Curvularia kusanoi TaxID=90978 RepID=A0A9P4WDM0_CURKU|nr:hypothetical protein E8E13_008624 [Curvularia kusanoi]